MQVLCSGEYKYVLKFRQLLHRQIWETKIKGFFVNDSRQYESWEGRIWLITKWIEKHYTSLAKKKKGGGLDSLERFHER